MNYRLGSDMPYCPECRGEYREGYSFCKECGVDLVEELPEEHEEESPQERFIRGKRLLQISAALIDRSESARSIRAICWILVAISLFYLIFSFSWSIYSTLSVYTPEYGFRLIYLALFFSVIPFTDSFVIAALLLTLAASLLSTHRSLLLKTQFYIALVFAILFSWGLVALIVDTIQNRELDSVVLSSMITATVAVAIYAFIAILTAYFTRALRRLGGTEVVENERG